MSDEHGDVASFADALEDWASAQRRLGRRPPRRLRLRAASIRLARCMRCGALAEWDYIPSGLHYCDACVPRGCDCQIVDKDVDAKARTVFEKRPDGETYVWTEYDGPEPQQYLDSFGRRLPCIEFDFYPGGFPARDADPP